MTTASTSRLTEILERVVIRFAGDSGDGMQLTGDRFTSVSATMGNDLATLPDYPAEIRAPAGTLAGVSAFQIHVSDRDVLTPGDAPNVLVAMNPAALSAHLGDLLPGGSVLLNSDAFDQRAFTKAGLAADPRTDGTLNGYNVFEVPMTSLTLEAVKPTGARPRDAERSKNFFALGLISWMYTRPTEETMAWIERRFGKNVMVAQANSLAFKAGFNFGETAELFDHPYEVLPAKLPSGTYTNISGNTALAWGLIAAAHQARLPLFLGSYPITPASDILHELSKHKNFGVRTVQAEDEIAGVGAAIGAAFAGHLAVTTTSGPGLDLKSETIGLAVSLELPLLIIDIQRGGPSTGLPTKTEQADLLAAMYGRHGECPLPIVAAQTPAHCFWAAIEAARIALTYRTPVILLSDGFLANGSEPWRLPDVSELPDLSVTFADAPNHVAPDGTPEFWPYLRDPETLARPWAIPGTPGLEHRVGGLEKADGTGNISYDTANHEHMVRIRAAKVAGVANTIPPMEVVDPWLGASGDNRSDAEILVLGWGSTRGVVEAAAATCRESGRRVATAHLVHLNPFPGNLGAVLRRYPKVIVPEMNLGQLSLLLRAEYLVDVRTFSKVQGLPFKSSEVVGAITAVLEGKEVDGLSESHGGDQS
jgi:2-oxoglutarate ferredoxin oxidoreductase subunit alpha